MGFIETLGLGAANTGMNLLQWHLQNRYNHPKRQIERMKEAGLNPALMYKQGSSGAGNASPVPAAEIGKYYTPKETRDLTESEQRLVEKKIQTEEQNKFRVMAETSSLLTGKEKDEFDLKFNKEIANYRIEGQKLQNENIRKQNEKIGQDIKESIARERQTLTNTELSILRDNRDAAKAIHEIALLKSQIEGNKAQTELWKESANKIKAETETINEIFKHWYSQGLNPNSAVWENLVLGVIRSYGKNRSLGKGALWSIMSSLGELYGFTMPSGADGKW